MVRKLSLKNTAYRYQHSLNLMAANHIAIHTYSTYTLRLKLTDRYGKAATTLRSYITIKRTPDKPEVLLSMLRLIYSQVVIDTARQ